MILSAIGVTALVYTRHRSAQLGVEQRADRRSASRCLHVVLAGFALWERRSVAHPMLDVSVFANRRFSGGSLAVTAGFLTLFGFIFVITQYFQFIKDYSAFETGVRLLPVAVSIALASVLGPRIVERIGTTAVVAGGSGHLRRRAWDGRPPSTRRTPYIEIAMQMLLLGGGLGLTTAPATEAIMGSLCADKAGVGSAVNDTTRELGGTLGVAIVGSVFASVYSGRLGSDSALAALPGDVRATMARSMAAAHKVIGQLPAAPAGRRPRRRRPRVPRRPSGRVAGLRRNRLGRGGRGRLAVARAGPTTSPQPNRSARTPSTYDRRRMKGKEMQLNAIPKSPQPEEHPS